MTTEEKPGATGDNKDPVWALSTEVKPKNFSVGLKSRKNIETRLENST